MSEPKRINYVTDDPAAAYNAGLDRAANREALRSFLNEWPTLAPDARVAARRIKTPEDWAAWRRGLEMERRGEFAGEEWARRFGEITMPARMLRASMLADQFHVPWGLAWLRLKDIGQLDGLVADNEAAE